MTIQNQEEPEFAPAIRGYDKTQVEEYLQQLREYAAELETRVVTAESELTRAQDTVADLQRQLAAAGGGTLPDRLGHILNLAEEEAREIRARARTEAEQIVQETQGRHQDIEEQIRQITRTRDGLLDTLTELGKQLQSSVKAHRTRAKSTDETQRIETPSNQRRPARAKAG